MKETVYYLSRMEVFCKLQAWDLFKTIVLVLCQLVMAVSGLFTCAVGLLFCSKVADHMPKLFWPWDNDVNTINGDPGWWLICSKSRFLGYATSYRSRFVWCALRNPCRNYSMWVGVRPAAVKFIWINKQYDEAKQQCNSLLVIAESVSGKRYVMWMPSWKLFGKWRFLGKFGFKLWDIVPLARIGEAEKRQFVFYPQIKRGVVC